ncbi:MAG: hypothetical protein ACRD0P_20370 [Stackebrandtia sp.]
MATDMRQGVAAATSSRRSEPGSSLTMGNGDHHHELGFARQTAWQALFMDGGAIVEQGRPETILASMFRLAV